MSIEITKPGKATLIVESPVMPAAGTMGFGDDYGDLIQFEKLGAFVTNPVTYHPWRPATGTRVVPLDAGILMHTGLPNRGVQKTAEQYRGTWSAMPLPVIVHLVATEYDHVRKGAQLLDLEETVDAIELGLFDDISADDAEGFTKAAVEGAEKPVIVRLPFQFTLEMAQAAVDGGADALVVCAPPRGTARDPLTGRLVSGRLYGPMIKPIVLRMVGQLARQIAVPVIGAGGIHTPQDARDYLEAGAAAVQVDAVTWLWPRQLEIISRDLGGLVVTREAGAFPDEWHPGMGETEKKARERAKRDDPARDAHRD